MLLSDVVDTQGRSLKCLGGITSHNVSWFGTFLSPFLAKIGAWIENSKL